MNLSFWRGKRIFVTGHTGFKGSWLCLWFKNIGARVHGYSLPPATEPSLFTLAEITKGMHSVTGDIRDRIHLNNALASARPEIVVHLAAQPLVRHSYLHPVETYETNVMGTVHLLETIRQCDTVTAVLIVTSDKCYENREQERGYRENDPMGGYDPYSSSKGCTELVTAAYRQSYFNSGKQVAIATARAGNVIGGGDWSSDRLIPDMVRAFSNGEKVIIRNPGAVRPWQHVFDALRGYLILLEKMTTNPEHFSGGWNFGPIDEKSHNVAWIVERFITTWGQAGWRVEKNHTTLHEAHQLTLDCNKAMDKLSWKPRLNIDRAIDITADWYRAHSEGKNMTDYSLRQLADFQNG